ncbi:hypothetical protein [Bacillus timonensis]|nr:hypothetical protein [Bacillus timonensis]
MIKLAMGQRFRDMGPNFRDMGQRLKDIEQKTDYMGQPRFIA